MQFTNLEVVAGEDKTFTLTARDSAHAIKDLTGASVSFRLQSQNRDGISRDQWAATIVNASAGTYSVAMSAADTEKLSGDYDFVGYATISNVTTVVNRGRLRAYFGAIN